MIYDIQKASLLKRFSAFLLDIILLFVLASGFAFLLAWITNIDSYTETMQAYIEEYGKRYGVDLNIDQEEFLKLSEDEQKPYNDAWEAIFLENPDAARAYNMTIALPMLIVTFALLLSHVVFEFVLPLCFKNGQTVGKKVFSLGVVFNNSVRLTNFALFVRSILGKYTIETMFPVLLVMLVIYGQMGLLAIILVAALLILQIVLLIVTKNNCFIHDILANTVVVDMQSQMVFDTMGELISFKEELHQEEVAKKDY